eukprot:CAMPEP_0196780292 /NCGR_PEP_ID=MMETSP1104-20130614/7455_1 /TAXON_ID=33652 /ORGANISM="Cafeteria sp., Strain Caron Lab Isolate" /LENGTH=279 /DNA_ID=CAMNT_0042150489 /DNA_START=100 /DNA_END=939 /DNA_ORIENTATION=+
MSLTVDSGWSSAALAQPLLEVGFVLAAAFAWHAVSRSDALVRRAANQLLLRKGCSGSKPDMATDELSRITWANHTVSLVHALFAIAVAAFSLASISPMGDDVCNSFAMAAARPALLAEIAYSVYDLWHEVAVMRPLGKMSVTMVFHHVFVASSMFASIQLDYLVWFMGALLVNDASTVFLNLRWFNFQLLSQAEGPARAHLRSLQLPLDLAFAGTFLLCRILWIPVLGSLFYANSMCVAPHVPDALTVISALNFPILWLLNVFWFSKIVAIATGSKRKA